MIELGPAWMRILPSLTHVFQPIVRFADGSLFAFEALLRGWEEAGFENLSEVFDRAWEDRELYALDMALRAKAFRKLAETRHARAKLFYNVDNRLLERPEYVLGTTPRLTAQAGLSASRIVFEVSEKHDPGDGSEFDGVLEFYKRRGFRVALDDFGSGYSGFKLLYRADPNYVKIDRYFIAGSAEDPRKATFLQKIVDMAHIMGIEVVAEGIESAEEYRICAGAGCDYAQGYYISKPLEDIRSCEKFVSDIGRHLPGERRLSVQSGIVGSDKIRMVPPIRRGAGFREILERFRRDTSLHLLPVIAEDEGIVGAYRERDFREYVYSPYGIALLNHLESESDGEALIVHPPISALGNGLARIVELYGVAPEAGAVLLTDQGRYAGLIEADTLLSLVAERELMEARDQNPLTRLPGNLRITSVCSERLADPGEGVVFAYYDFDNFKPFNDRYGFRSGDRVIMLFADILRSMVKTPRDFVGHLGGDDFFACLEAPDAEGAFGRLVETARRFSRDVRSFYSAEDRERGWIIGKDESRTERPMGLLTVSVAAVHVGPGADMDAEELTDLFADLKRKAKLSPEGTAFLRRGPVSSRPSDSGTSPEPDGDRVPVVRSRREPTRSGTNPVGAF